MDENYKNIEFGFYSKGILPYLKDTETLNILNIKEYADFCKDIMFPPITINYFDKYKIGDIYHTKNKDGKQIEEKISNIL